MAVLDCSRLNICRAKQECRNCKTLRAAYLFFNLSRNGLFAVTAFLLSTAVRVFYKFNIELASQSSKCMHPIYILHVAHLSKTRLYACCSRPKLIDSIKTIGIGLDLQRW